MTKEEIKDFCDMKAQLEPENEDIYKAIIKALEQEPQTFKWCTNCKEYDQEKHCCHRWSNVIRDTVEEMKQEYIEREVLDEIRAEIEEQVLESLSDGGDDWFTAEKVNECLDTIDKYR